MNFEVKVNLIYFLKRGTPSTLNNLNQLERLEMIYSDQETT